MYFTYQIDDKIQYDLIYLLNPLLANFTYEGSHNKNINDLKNNLHFFHSVNITPNNNLSNFNDNLKIEHIPDENTVNLKLESIRAWYMNEKTLLSALKTILEYSDNFDELGLTLYRYFTSERYTETYNYHLHTQNMRINKLLSLYYQLKIIKG